MKWEESALDASSVAKTPVYPMPPFDSYRVILISFRVMSAIRSTCSLMALISL
jgi:hypothetical protein